MAYNHGIGTTEIPTSLQAPVQVASNIPVVFGTAPVHLSKRGTTPVNEPVLCYTRAEAVEAFGYSDDWEQFTLCEFIYSHFSLFEMAPIVLINVLDPEKHKESNGNQVLTLSKGTGVLDVDGVLKSDLTVKSADNQTTYTDTDYIAAYNSDGKLTITVKPGGTIPQNTTSLSVSFTKLKPSDVKEADIIGGVEVDTGKATGLELIGQVFPRFRVIPGQILSPRFSQSPLVAAVMKAKSSNINGHFSCISLSDIPTDTVTKYTDAPAWKNDNNITANRQISCYPMVSLGDRKFHLSTQVAGAICKTNAQNEGVPYESPSNKSLQADGAILKDGSPVFLGPDQANYLNSQGIVTALNFTNGWKVWGNHTAAYPAVTDPKDQFIPVRNMFDWLINTIILTYWQKVDGPINNRLIESITDSINLWLNGLTSRGFILGGRIEFVKDENAVTSLIDGIMQFHLYVTPPTPAREINFLIEYDPSYFNSLFAA